MFPMIRMNRSYPINIENKTRRLIIDVPYKMLDINAGMIPTAYIVWDIRDVFLFVNVLVSTIPSDYHWVKLLTTYDAFLNQLSCESLYLSDYVYYILGNVYLKRISTYYNVLVFKYSFIYILLFLKSSVVFIWNKQMPAATVGFDMDRSKGEFLNERKQFTLTVTNTVPHFSYRRSDIWE